MIIRYAVATFIVAFTGFGVMGGWNLSRNIIRDGIITGFEQFVTPHYSVCGKCHKPWNFVKSHTTVYALMDLETRNHFAGRSDTVLAGTMGMFPLCETCWESMTPSERLPYYHELYASWGEARQDCWPAIEKAVMAGG
jgi:hypothetical protein